MPGRAHHAVAELVRRGAVRVVVTTNFDRLIEQALDAAGVPYQVVASPSAIQGMEPLVHARCTVIKLHGDYTRIDQLNTVEELSAYPADLLELLRRVLDEYGLIVNGWSGDWDRALVAAVEETRVRRYPLLWASYGTLGDAARQLVNRHRAMVVQGAAAAADVLFPDLVSRLEALDSMSSTPLSRAMAVAQVKRLLPEPTRYIQLQDQFDAEIDRIREFLQTRGSNGGGGFDGAAWQATYDDLRARTDTLLHMLANGVYLDRHRLHTTLWVRVVEQLMTARPRIASGQTYQDSWISLHHYPAALALKAASVAAVAAGRDDVLFHLLNDPTWQEEFWRSPPERPARDVLHDFRVVVAGTIDAFPRWGFGPRGSGWMYPQSHLFRTELQPVFKVLLGDEASYDRTFFRTEYRTALIQHRAKTADRYRVASGEFIGEGQWDAGTLIWETDFRAFADRETWGWTAGAEADQDMDTELSVLATDLRKNSRWG